MINIMKKFTLIALLMGGSFFTMLYAQYSGNYMNFNNENFLHFTEDLPGDMQIGIVKESNEKMRLLPVMTDDGFLDRLAMVNLPRRSYFINTHFGSSNLINKSIKDEGWDSKGGFGYQFEAGYYRKLKPLIAFGFGLGISSYANQISIDVLNDTITGFNDADQGVTPADDYHERIAYFNPTEDTRITYLDFPLFVEIGNPNIDKIGYFIRLGLKISTPIADNFSGTGNYSVKGYYPDYGVELEGIKDLGFVSNKAMFIGNSDYELNPINISGMASGGISLVLTTNWLFRAGIQYVHGFTDISKNVEMVNQARQTNRNHILESENSGTFTKSLGIELGVQYTLGLF
jgi:hypothetical protein